MMVVKKMQYVDSVITSAKIKKFWYYSCNKQNIPNLNLSFGV